MVIHMEKADGMNYAPVSEMKVKKVVGPGDFKFAAVGFDHGHIYGMCNGLTEAGANLEYIYDEDEEKLKEMLQRYPGVKVACSLEEILENKEIQLVASACIPCKRAELGCQVLQAGKHYFTDKPGMTSYEQLSQVRNAVTKSGKKFYIYFGERLHVESAVFVQKLIDDGKLGKVISVNIMAPHRLNAKTRPTWFFDLDRNGTILNDIGSHQYEQFLAYTGSKKAEVLFSRMINYDNKEYSKFADYGDVILKGDSGASGYCRLDWLTPDGMGAWGDGRVFIVGTKATVEIRKYIDLAGHRDGDHVFFVDDTGEHRYDVKGKIGYPFFGEFILDCIHGTENSMTQEHVFESMRIALEASEKAMPIIF